MPTPSASPPSDMMFSVTPALSSGRNVATTEIGMVMAMMPVASGSRRKK